MTMARLAPSIVSLPLPTPVSSVEASTIVPLTAKSIVSSAGVAIACSIALEAIPGRCRPGW